MCSILSFLVKSLLGSDGSVQSRTNGEKPHTTGTKTIDVVLPACVGSIMFYICTLSVMTFSSSHIFGSAWIDDDCTDRMLVVGDLFSALQS